MQRAHRYRQSSEAHNSVHHYVGWFDEICEVVDDLRERKGRGNFCATRVVGDGNDLRAKLECLPHEHVDRTANTERNYLIAIALGANNIQCLLADGPGRTGDRDANSYLVTQGCRWIKR